MRKLVATEKIVDTEKVVKSIKPGESMTVHFGFALDKPMKESDNTLVIEFELPDPELYPQKRKHKVVLSLDEGVDEK